MNALLLMAALTAAPPEVALLSSRGDADVTELRFQRAGTVDLAPVVASFSHVRRSTALGALLPGSRTVLAVAQTVDSRDVSFAASLFKLEPGQAPVTLASGVAISSRPFVTPTGRAFVQRGPPPTAAGWDSRPTLDELNLRTGALRTVLRADAAPLLYPVAFFDAELFVYRFGGAQLDLVAVHVDTLAVRTVVPNLPDAARDFVADGGILYFSDVRGRLQRVELRSGKLTTLVQTTQDVLLPTLLPRGLAMASADGLRTLSGELALASQGPGFDRVRFVRDGWAVGLNEVPSDFPTAFAVELKSGRALKFPAPAASRLDLCGVVE